MTREWLSKDVDMMIAAQLKKHFSKEERRDHPFVTISREYGCNGKDLAAQIVARMNEGDAEKRWRLVDRHSLADVAQGDDLTEETIAALEKYGHSDIQSYIREAIFGMENLAKTVRQVEKLMQVLAGRGHVVILGGGASIMTEKFSRGLHVRLYAPETWRVANHAKRWDVDAEKARKRVHDRHIDREAFVRTFLGRNVADPNLYHLCLNNARLDTERAADIVVHLLKAR